MSSRAFRFGVPIAALALAASMTAAAQERVEDYKYNLAPNVRSPQRAVDRMLELARLKPGETLYDLGCGEGQILIAAAERYGVKGVGIEISRRLSQTAQENVKHARLQDRITIIQGNFLNSDLSRANVVTLYLAPLANESLRPNLERQLRPNTRVVSYDYPIPGWTPVDTSETVGHQGAVHTIYLYEVPGSIGNKK